MICNRARTPSSGTIADPVEPGSSKTTHKQLGPNFSPTRTAPSSCCETYAHRASSCCGGTKIRRAELFVWRLEHCYELWPSMQIVVPLTSRTYCPRPDTQCSFGCKYAQPRTYILPPTRVRISRGCDRSSDRPSVSQWPRKRFFRSLDRPTM